MRCKHITSTTAPTQSQPNLFPLLVDDTFHESVWPHSVILLVGIKGIPYLTAYTLLSQDLFMLDAQSYPHSVEQRAAYATRRKRKQAPTPQFPRTNSPRSFVYSRDS